VPGRYALIVATDEYKDPKLNRLRTPATDAAALADVLGDPEIGDFEVQLATNEPDHMLRRRIAAFFGDRRRDDLLLLHFSCHGLKDDSGQLYFATTDTEVAYLDASAIPAEFVSRQMAISRSNSVLMLLDCCYSGAIARGLRFRAGDRVDVDDHLGGHGRVIITASNAMEYAFEGDELTGEGKPSVFTSAVVKALETGEADRDQDRWIEVRELYDYVCDEVREVTPHQRPNLLSHLEGDLYVARSRYIAAVSLPTEVLDALANPLASVRVGAVAALEELLRGPDRTLAAAAHDRLNAVAANDDSRRVTSAARTALAATGDSPPTTQPRVKAVAPPAEPEPPPAAVPAALHEDAGEPAPTETAPPPEAPPEEAAAPPPAAAPSALLRWARRDWPLPLTAMGALLVVAGWTSPWVYESSMRDVIDEVDSPADGLLAGLLVPAGLAAALVLLALIGRRPRFGWWALALIGGWSLGVVVAVIDREWSQNPRGRPGGWLTTLGLYAVIAGAVAIARRAPRIARPSWPGDAVAAPALLVLWAVMKVEDFGGEENERTARVWLATFCLLAALLAVGRLLRVRYVRTLLPAAAIALVGAAAAGQAACAERWPVMLVGVAAALGGLYSAVTSR
jgi:hypothetical protein